MSGVLSSWLASAVKRRSAANDVSRRESIAFTVRLRRDELVVARVGGQPSVEAPTVGDRLDLVDQLRPPAERSAHDEVRDDDRHDEDDRREHDHRADEQLRRQRRTTFVGSAATTARCSGSAAVATSRHGEETQRVVAHADDHAGTRTLLRAAARRCAEQLRLVVAREQAHERRRVQQLARWVEHHEVAGQRIEEVAELLGALRLTGRSLVAAVDVRELGMQPLSALQRQHDAVGDAQGVRAHARPASRSAARPTTATPNATIVPSNTTAYETVSRARVDTMASVLRSPIKRRVRPRVIASSRGRPLRRPSASSLIM